ncbi:hypothetical protein [Pseudoruegeria sp. SHC-113]|uniref:hypothetical protein n=1 Tax=Pseudoruegeria sp. SHC-113 TaxID=2855439 RepID=UPI0021BAFA6A|nr:hypothetical protein [Pseudoruegeria sp. SHC-113]MCT8160154.1 hypothetical protein [Pseudoruegeria sp. SHC-113]
MTLPQSPASTPRRLLILGFSNVASTLGFSVPLAERLQVEVPGLSVERLGLGALQPAVVPAFLAEADAQLGPFTDVLLEINTSGFALHPLATEARAREILLDCLRSVTDIGARPCLLLHHRDMQGKAVLDFNAITRDLAAACGVPVIDLAEGLATALGPAYGPERMRALFKDVTHTTEEGTAWMAEEVARAYAPRLRAPLPALPQVPLPAFRRRFLDLTPFLPEGMAPAPQVFSALSLPYLFLPEGVGVEIDLPAIPHAMALCFLYHANGGRSALDLWDGAQGRGTATLVSKDHVSHFRRIGAHAFDFFRGQRLARIGIGPLSPMPEVALRSTADTGPSGAYIGPLIEKRPVPEL